MSQRCEVLVQKMQICFHKLTGGVGLRFQALDASTGIIQVFIRICTEITVSDFSFVALALYGNKIVHKNNTKNLRYNE